MSVNGVDAIAPKTRLRAVPITEVAERIQLARYCDASKSRPYAYVQAACPAAQMHRCGEARQGEFPSCPGLCSAEIATEHQDRAGAGQGRAPRDESKRQRAFLHD